MGKLITNAGFVIGTFGFLFAWFAEPRMIGISIFIAGFYLAIAGYVTDAVISWKADGGKAMSQVGISVGLAIASGSYIASTFFNSDQVASLLFYSGAAVLAAGIVGSWFIKS